jgi:hypothetical protein
MITSRPIDQSSRQHSARWAVLADWQRTELIGLAALFLSAVGVAFTVYDHSGGLPAIDARIVVGLAAVALLAYAASWKSDLESRIEQSAQSTLTRQQKSDDEIRRMREELAGVRKLAVESEVRESQVRTENLRLQNEATLANAIRAAEETQRQFLIELRDGQLKRMQEELAKHTAAMASAQGQERQKVTRLEREVADAKAKHAAEIASLSQKLQKVEWAAAPYRISTELHPQLSMLEKNQAYWKRFNELRGIK